MPKVMVQNIDSATNFRGTYFISLFSKETIDFQIRDPKGYVIFTKINRKEAIFNINVTMAGNYEFVFINKRVRGCGDGVLADEGAEDGDVLDRRIELRKWYKCGDN